MLQDVPTILGNRYRIVERLGRGGMADVYRAEDVVLRRAVAVKVFRGGVEREQHLARFRTEVRTLAALTHPHLVALYDAGGDITEPWCAMEYVDGGSLADREGPVPPADVARIGEQVATGLAYVHGRGIVHRDVKPSNVLIDSGGDAFLSDFGIAKLVDGTRMTQSGLMIGTAAFLSPEQVRGRSAGPPCDVYALGLVLLEALTGRREYPGSPVESAVARLSRPPQVPDELAADWGELLVAMTTEEPDDRPTPDGVVQQLRAIARRIAHRAAGRGPGEVGAVTADAPPAVVLPAVVRPVAGAEESRHEESPHEATAEEPARAPQAGEATGEAEGSGGPADVPDVPEASDGQGPAGAGPVGGDAAEVTVPRLPAPVVLTGSVPPGAPSPHNLLSWFSPERRRRAGAATAAAAVVVVVALVLPLVDGRRSDGVDLGSADGGTTPTQGPSAPAEGDDGLQVRLAPVGDVPASEPTADPIRSTGRSNPRGVQRQPRVAGVATTRPPSPSATVSNSPSPTPSPSTSSPTATPTPTSSASVTVSPSPSTSASVTPTGPPTGSATPSATVDPTTPVVTVTSSPGGFSSTGPGSGSSTSGGSGSLVAS